MLVDAAKGGDVEIPVFCYEPKLGEPVGACRMCLVEIEGIPKLQTACSTPVRDGMVVYTQTDRVIEAQNAVVEFLLVNHPLDCPVCDKGGECPLQDIAMGWGPGRSRVTDPKRHFQKPMPLSPLVRIDRERCILCYRCVRFSQEVAEDEQLQLLERGDSQLRRHLRRPPLHRPLPRQHHRALPGGRADLGGLPLPRPALGHRGRGLDLHALPEPVQRQVHRPRRARPAGAGARQPRGRRRLALRQGPLRLPDDQLAEDRITEPPRGAARGRAGTRRSRPRPKRLRASRRADRGDRRRPDLERGGLPGPAHRARRARLRRTSTAARRAAGAEPARRSRRPSSPPRSRDDRRRRGDPRHRHRPAARDADPRPAPAQGGAPRRRPARGRLRAPDRARRRRRGDGALRARRRRRASSPRSPPSSAGRRPAAPGRAAAEAAASRRRGIVSRRAAARQDRDRLRRAARPRARAARRALAALLELRASARRRPARRPRGANGRGLREVGCLPGAGPGFAGPPAGRGARGDQQGLLERRARRRSCSSTPTRSATTPTAPAGPRRSRARNS